MKRKDIDRIYELIDTSNVELKTLVDQLVSENIHDELTKTCNRRVLDDNMEYDVVVMCDIDNFKIMNDKHGHLIGDKILVIISDLLKKVTREEDFVCRFGGDEFLIILKKCSIEDAKTKFKKIERELPLAMLELGLNITLSVGITEYELNKTLAKAIEEADNALYKSKRLGKNRITTYKETIM